VSFGVMVHVHRISDYPDFFFVSIWMANELMVYWIFVSCQR